MSEKIAVAILGASGYTGAELVRMLALHPRVRIAALTADRKAGSTMAEAFPQFTGLDLPRLIAIGEVDWASIDLVFCALPHATTQEVLKAVPASIKIVDLSADFRLSDPEAYAYWYGHAHKALELQAEAVYGITELDRAAVAKARLVANPGCYTTCGQLPVIPLLEAGAIDPDSIVIDAKSGVSGAGRAAKEANLFTEVSEGFHAYGVGHHRHMAELEQGFSKAAGRPVRAAFTPHLVPMNRGILSTIYVKLQPGRTAEDLHAILAERYQGEHFVKVLPFGASPQTRHVRGSNFVFMSVAADRRPGHAILLCVLDNLVKGASGQAIQNMNVMMGWPETTGLEQIGLFP
ncbi:N-acetyl-gamma-glutamyl-phosphate reductase [Prosthecomicrobium hirschii]|uniref:N-acetyl-gamma-glutamyl-phosphate reductase n=1 Tax=Prosthecodimorpha hirschii TaxID=665126 RepID=A0A0P6VLK3_9HYPH|nr:N-acetyl-gamma-glutamyl-phosphate reductase [Prosthecomicrobium hirschii]KPL50998.1 N-acetyl-gamma-glutamyl-phosphate reductase [Prosthecomicrobium hirschii]MCW1839181.1 N-acetyl-gamma-glutamyl-phosphate reductase [Prosthecomicrobium hirschii]